MFFFAAYVHRGWGNSDSESRTKENVEFIVNAVHAVEEVCPNLQFWTFPTGGKWYGFEFGNAIQQKLPLKESTPRLGPPYGEHIFYYPQIDALKELSEGKKWAFADIRPDAIVGFVPNHNPMNIAEPLALYCSLWASLNPSSPIPFPGPASSYKTLASNGSQDQIAKFSIFASLHKEKSAGKAFNIADTDQGLSWENTWPGIAQWFGLVGGEPREDVLSGEAWVKSTPIKSQWDAWTSSHHLRPKVLDNTCWEFMSIVAGEYASINRQFDLSEARRIGYTETMDHVKGYHVAFERMRKAGIIP